PFLAVVDMDGPHARTRDQHRWRLYRPLSSEASRPWGTWLPWAALLLTTLATTGCDAPKPPPAASMTPVSAPHSHFDPTNARTIGGRVVWQGPEPQVLPFEIMPNPLSGVILQQSQQRANPNRPTIDPRTHAIDGAVVFLRGVDATRARPWD